jgi:hypothetical protein
VVLGKSKSSKPAPGFALETGVELSSAQTNFSTTDTRFAAGITWEFPLRGDTSGGRLLFSSTVNVTSVLKSDFTKACQPGLQRIAVGKNIANIQPPVTACGVGVISKSMDTLTLTVPTIGFIANQTAQSVRAVGTLRWEHRAGSGPVYLGPAFSFGFQTNPDPIKDPNMLVFGFLGLTLRQVTPGTLHSVFRLDLLYGVTGDFSSTRTDTIRVRPSASPGDSVFETPTPSRFYRSRVEVRLLAEPLPGFYLRGFALLSKGGPDIVQVAFLKALDIEQVFSSILGKPKT